MASFSEHIQQTKSNLSFLEETNAKNQQFWDWQVTVCFYVAVHTVNAHLAQCANLHYRTHEDVKNAINPFNQLAMCKVPNDVYLCYAKLEGLSRRSRYLCHDDKTNTSTVSHFTYDRHFAKAIKNLDKLLDYFNTLYSLGLTKIKIACLDLSAKDQLKLFDL